MGRIMEYPTQDEPADADSLLSVDASAPSDKTKLLPISTLKNYINAAVSALPSTDGHLTGDYLAIQDGGDIDWETPASGSVPSTDGHSAGDTLTIQSGGGYDWETPSGGGSGIPVFPVVLKSTATEVLTSADGGKTVGFTYDWGDITVTLPAANAVTNGTILTLKSLSGYTITYNAAGSDVIDVAGFTSDTLAGFAYCTLVSNGVDTWYRIAKGTLL